MALSVADQPGEEANLRKLVHGGEFRPGALRMMESTMDIPHPETAFDVHPLRPPSGHVMLWRASPCRMSGGWWGISMPNSGCHTVTDAILLARWRRADIGTPFPAPPIRKVERGRKPTFFLTHAVEMAAAEGFTVTHRITLICERPKIGPHAAVDLRVRMAGAFWRMEKTRVSVKATTNEGLGFAGRGGRDAAMATVRLVKS